MLLILCFCLYYTFETMKCVVCLVNDAIMRCCPAGLYCSDQCREIHIVAPHTCIVPQMYDPPCDLNTDYIAERLHQVITNSSIFKNDKPRKSVDGNRSEAYDEPFRRKLRKVATPGSCIIEVHSFHSSSDFGVLDNVDIVILSMYKDDGLEEQFLRGLSNAVIIEGHKTVNDIGLEANKRGWRHVILEFRDTLSRETIERHIQEIKKIVK